MSKMKPYIFWIVCGLLLLVELVVFIVVSPSANGKSPTEIKSLLDDQKKTLDKLRTQAANGHPDDHPFNPLDPTDMATLKTKWLPTRAWQPGLSDLLNQYQGQMNDILAYLDKRSAPLHRPISTEQDGFHWYEAYAKATGDLLESLYTQKCLVVPNANATPGSAVQPNPGQPPAALQDQIQAGSHGNGGHEDAPAAPAATSDDETRPNFQTDATLRQVAQFMTTTTSPKAEEYEGLTTKFRIMEMVAKILLNTTATNATSPMLKQRQPVESHAKLQSTTWKDMGDDVITMQIVLTGPLSALLAVESALEQNKDGSDEPVRIVTGATLDHKEFGVGERIGISSEPVVLHLDLAILDFSTMAKNPISVLPVPPKNSAPKPASAPAPRVVPQDTSDTSTPSARSSAKDE